MFDGHAGSRASTYTAEHLHLNIKTHIPKGLLFLVLLSLSGFSIYVARCNRCRIVNQVSVSPIYYCIELQMYGYDGSLQHIACNRNSMQLKKAAGASPTSKDGYIYSGSSVWQHHSHTFEVANQLFITCQVALFIEASIQCVMYVHVQVVCRISTER